MDSIYSRWWLKRNTQKLTDEFRTNSTQMQQIGHFMQNIMFIKFDPIRIPNTF